MNNPYAQHFDEDASSYDDNLKNILGLSESFDTSVFVEYKIKLMKENISFEPRTILEFGCGTGRNLACLRQHFPNATIYGCDVSAKSLEEAQARNIENTQFYHIISTEQLIDAFCDIDLVFSANVFHHIPFVNHQEWLTALHTIQNNNMQSPNKYLIIFEHNPYNPYLQYKLYSEFHGKHKFGSNMIQPCRLKRLLKRAGFINIKSNYAMFFLKRTETTEKIERKLKWLPMGAQYYIECRLTD